MYGCRKDSHLKMHSGVQTHMLPELALAINVCICNEVVSEVIRSVNGTVSKGES